MTYFQNLIKFMENNRQNKTKQNKFYILKIQSDLELN